MKAIIAALAIAILLSGCASICTASRTTMNCYVVPIHFHFE